MEDKNLPPDSAASMGMEVSEDSSGMSREDCMNRITKSLKDPTVRFLRDQMEKAGCPVWVRLLMAANCKNQGLAGGYSSRNGIRANHLSGDCHYKREMLRGFMKIRGHEQECVKRRALKSVKNNPYCSEAAAKDAIAAVWDICYEDTSPFERAP
ncbi:mitochondrial inner membrane protease ATP23-like isoform X4 [Dendrobium catenatum]|uniref:mitochondrial inner membrane protease ATP23-like isoform X4 n=1 Tax=Dendrobium catenatum TaxID=906689 RepID=UPI0010A05BF9|nr:mitochondrial inner membrane protease ATP23-like isoform X4 [Dendrobium catenatum]